MPERRGAEGADLEIRLLGGCEIVGRSGPIHLESAKTTAVLVHLAVVGGAVARRRLAPLLWPDLVERRAAANLRRAIWDLRRRLNLPGRPPLLEATQAAVALAPARVRVDVVAFRAALRARPPDLAAAAELYRGELLAGFRLDDAGSFEEWAAIERERLRAALLDGLEEAVARCRAAGQVRAALGWARRLAAADPWRESAHRQVIDLLLLAGDAGAALAQYETCRRLLAEELQAEPSAATTALVARIRAAGGTARRERPPGLPPPHDLPSFATPFVGRGEELAELAARLDDPEVTLLTLVGPGGIGKTRLAVQAAWRAIDPGSGGDRRFPDGAWFVPPLDGRGPDALAAALAERFALTAAAGDARPLGERLLDFARDRRMLWIVDGAEHVLDEARALARRLGAAPELVLLLTSRERLGLDAEWVFGLAGLDLPESGLARDAESSAVRLFVQSVRRLRLGFEPTESDLVAAGEICRRLEGSPLGIELAAGWSRTLALDDLALELADDLALLSESPAGPDTGLRAVFAASWARLDDDDRRALARLAVFRGGMAREDAEAVSGAGLGVLARLVERSLVRRDPSGRFGMHEVLHSCAEARLAETGATAAAARARHAEIFARRAASAAAAAGAPAGRAALEALSVELDNLFAAWRWACAAGAVTTLAALLDATLALAESAGRAAEMARLVTVAADLALPAALAARLDVARARLANRLGDYAMAEAAAARALADGGGPLDTRDRARARFALADAAYLAGRYSEAAPLLDAALGAAGDGDPELAAAVWDRKGRAAVELGDLEAAERAFASGRALALERGDEGAAARFLAELGHVAYFRGDLDLAARRCAEARARTSAAGDHATQALALHGLAFVAEEEGRFAEAVPLYQESLELSREAGDRRGVAQARMLLGENARLRGDLAAARSHYEGALAGAREIGGRYLAGLLAGNLAYVAAAAGDPRAALERVAETLDAYRASRSTTILLPALIAMASVARARGRSELALALLGAAAAHPANRHDHQVEVDRVLAALGDELPARTIEAGLAAGRGRPLEDLAMAALADLQRPPDLRGGGS